MKISKIVFILSITALLAFGCGGGGDPSGPGGVFDNLLVATWNLLTYTVEEEDLPSEGFITFQSNGSFNGEIVFFLVETVTFSGSASTSSNQLSMTVTQSSDTEWIEEETTVWDYTVSNNVLTMESEIEGEDYQIVLSTEELADVYGDISGTVIVSGTGYPLEGATISVVGSGKSEQTQYDGTYEIENVPVGTFTVQASKSGYIDSEENNVEILEDQEITVDFSLVKQTTGEGSVEGFVIDIMNLAPIQGAQVVVAGTGYSGDTDSQGYYEIESVPVGTYDITASKSGYESSTLPDQDVLDSEALYADFGLLPEGTTNYGTLRGVISNIDTGTGIPNVVVQVEGTINTGLSCADGTYEVLLIPEAVYNVTYTKVGYDTETESGVQIIADDITDLNVEMKMMSGTGTIVCYVVEELTELPVSGVLIEILDTSFTGETNLLGNHNFQSVPTGVYEVQFSKDKYETQIVENVEVLSGVPVPLRVELERH